MRLRHCCWGLLLGGLLWAQPREARTPAQDPEASAIHVPRLNAQRNGILQQIVYCLERDRLGRVWAGTRTGPYVYDGRRWTPLNLPEHAKSRQLRAILLGADGADWFGTQEGGIWRHRLGDWRHFGPEEGLPSERINALLPWTPREGKSQILAATAEGIALWDGTRWVADPANRSLPHPWVWRLRELEEPGGGTSLWAATERGIAKRVGDAWTTPVPQPPKPAINDLALEPGSGALWASIWNQGVARWNGREWNFPGRDTRYPGNRPTCLTFTRDARGRSLLWAGSSDHGLAVFQEGNWTELPLLQGLGTSGALALLPDPGGGHPFLWVGTRGGGVTTLGLSGVARMVNRSTGLPGTDIRSFAEAPGPGGPDTFWMGTRQGAAGWNGQGWALLAAGLPDPEIFSLARAADGSLWAGTGRGVARLPPGAKAFRELPGIEARVHCLGLDGPEVWAGTAKGLRAWSPHGWRAFPNGPGSSEVYALAFTRDPEGRRSLWAATNGQGLWQYTAERWTRHDPNPKTPQVDISCLLVSPGPRGTRWLWVGVQGNGLARLDVARPDLGWRSFSTRNPIPLSENTIRAITRDAAGHIYIAQSLGICRITLDDSGNEIRAADFLGNPEGLPSLPAHYCSGYMDRKGQIWFGFPDEAAILDPHLPAPQPRLPLPAIETFQVHGRPVELAPGAVLSHRQSRLVFEFFLPSFFREEEILFRSQLVGFEEEPGPWGLENRREFQDLPAGRYQLRVWARDAHGRASEPFDFPFQVRPAPWKHPLAYGAYTTLAVLGVLGVVRLRTRLLMERTRHLEVSIAAATAELRYANRQLEQANEEKSLFLGIAAHDLKNPLNGIILMIDVLAEEEEDPAEVREIHGKIRKAASRMAELISRLLDVSALESGRRPMRIEPVELEPLVNHVMADYAAVASAKGLRLEKESPKDPVRALADEATLREILDNLVSNALKFTPPGPPERVVRIRIGEQGGEAVLEVEDQGPGFTEADQAKAFARFERLSARPTAGEQSTGLGLSIVKQFTEAMGGRVELESEPGHGATLRLVLPMA